MTDQISLATAMQLFRDQVQLRYQNRQYLANTIEEVHGTKGDAMNVPVSDEVEMSEIGFAPTDLPVTVVEETNKIVIPKNYAIKTTIGGGEQTLFAYNKIVIHSKLHALAAARLVDFVKINAIFSDADVGSIYTVPVDVGPNNGVNQFKMSDALGQLENNGVDIMNYSCSMWMPALIKKAMMADPAVVNFFFNDKKPLVDNTIQTYLGTDIRVLGEAGVNKIPSTTVDDTTTYLVPIVHEDAVIQSFNRDIKSDIIWVPQQDRYELVTVVTTGAKLIQYRGVAFITAELPYALNA